MKYALSGIVLLLCLLHSACFCQESTSVPVTDRILNFPSRFFQKVNAQSADMDQKITRQSEKYLQRLAKKEAKLREKMFRQDSVAAKRIFDNNPLNYTALLQKLQNPQNSGVAIPASAGTAYIPYLDSVKTSLKFLQQNQGALANSSAWQGQAGTALAQVTQLQSKIQVSEQIQQLVRQRKDQIREALSQYSHVPTGLQSSYQGYSQQAYYYGAQLKAYREELDDPDQITKRGLSLLNKTRGFQSFMKTHSDLASLFGTPGGSGGSNAKALAGLQTRSGVQQQLQGQVTSGGPDAGQVVNQQIQSARTKLKALQDKVTQAGGGSSSMDVPDFKPNTQKTKSLLGRLEGGINVQSLPSTANFPTTTDFGASLGYKLNDKNIISVGASYKMGWGKDIRHIAITSQGLGLRSSFQTRIKGSFSAYGGFEYNYQQISYAVSQLRNLNYWTRSGLLGVSKQYRINSKLKGNLELLWDVLSYWQIPRTQSFLFRIGYSF